MKINKDLVKERNISEEDVKKIEEIYEEIEYLISTSRKMDANRIMIGERMEEYEYLLQELWGFERDSLFHTHYMKIPGCTCPRMDNKDDLGHRRTINGDCPFHSHKI